MKIYLGKFADHRWNGWLYKALGREPKQVEYVKVDPWDTWNADCTLAKIIVPMLEQLRDTTHGSPVMDWEDRPDHLIGCKIDPNSGEVDEFFHQSWDWALTDMIYAFQYAQDKFDIFPEDVDYDRVKNGFRLFGKYYQNLWD